MQADRHRVQRTKPDPQHEGLHRGRDRGSEQAIAMFKRAAQDMPVHACSSCEELQFAKRLRCTDKDTLNKLDNAVVNAFVLCDGKLDYQFCYTCFKNIRHGIAPANSQLYGTRFVELPPAVAKLTQFEAMLVAPRLAMAKFVEILPQANRDKKGNRAWDIAPLA